jgi:hypothetical protein
MLDVDAIIPPTIVRLSPHRTATIISHCASADHGAGIRIRFESHFAIEGKTKVFNTWVPARSLSALCDAIITHERAAVRLGWIAAPADDDAVATDGGGTLP